MSCVVTNEEKVYVNMHRSVTLKNQNEIVIADWLSICLNVYNIFTLYKNICTTDFNSFSCSNASNNKHHR